MWLSLIGDMIIYSASSRPSLLGGITQALDVAIVVIGPYDGHIIRENQTIIILIQNLLVRCEGLRNLRGRSAEIFFKDIPLVCDRFLKHGCLLVVSTRKVHRIIVDTTQGDCIYILIVHTIPHPGFKNRVYSFLVVAVTPFAIDLLVPFDKIIVTQRLTMTCTYNDAIFTCHLLIFRIAVECDRTYMHGRQKMVCLHAQQQFAYSCICLGADGSALRLIGLAGPDIQTEVLVIDKDAPVFD